MRGRLISWEGREPDCLYYICWHWQAWGGLTKVSMTFPLYIFVIKFVIVFEFWIVLKKKKEKTREKKKREKKEERKEDEEENKKEGKNTSGMEGGRKEFGDCLCPLVNLWSSL